jgi:uncharacterized BrkB/YihY/UPF0761 family membrane protein
LGVTQKMANALDQVWGVPRKERPDFFMSRVRGLLLLVLFGVTFIVASGASGVVSSGLVGPALKVAGYVSSLALNFALFLISFKVLCSADLNWRELVPGAALGAIFWTILQAVGGVYIDHFAKSGRYGIFALVIGILAWLHLGAQLSMYALELNSVLSRKLWPRSLFDDPQDLVEADQRDAA